MCTMMPTEKPIFVSTFTETVNYAPTGARKMTSFDPYEAYKGIGNGTTPCNDENISKIRLVRLSDYPQDAVI